MLHYTKQGSITTGLSPGTMVHVGERRAETIRIRVIDYDADHIDEKELKAIEECVSYKDENTVTWVNVHGLHQVDIIEKVGQSFELHPLVLEDIVNTDQRPKIEDYEDYIFIVTKMIFYDDAAKQIRVEQFSLILGTTYIISFQELAQNAFGSIRKRLLIEQSRLRRSGPDYLAYALIDLIVDNYFLVLEKISEDVEGLEEAIIHNPTPEISQNLNRLKKGLVFLRKSVWPLREVISAMQRVETGVINEKTDPYLRDLYDHTIQVIDSIETLRDIVSGMLNVYLATVSNRMNEIMKFLTMMATVFIPITFLAGIYGMNFKYMPELEWKWGYPAILSLVGGIVLLMVAFFKRKKWL